MLKKKRIRELYQVVHSQIESTVFRCKLFIRYLCVAKSKEHEIQLGPQVVVHTLPGCTCLLALS